MGQISATRLGMEAEQDEWTLVSQLRLGSAAAQAELFNRLAPRLQGFAEARLGGDTLLAEDVVVETLTDAMQDIKRFRGGSLSAWIYGIARRRIWQEVRRQKRLKVVPASAQVSLHVAETAARQDVSEEAAARLEARRKADLIAGCLAETEFEILILSSIDELSAKEIAQVVGRSERAVHSLLHRARQKARERLHNEERTG